jgi:YD repeat-containing protein
VSRCDYVTDRGLRATHAYDDFGNLTSTLFSDGGVVTMQYDVYGRMTTMTDQLGRITSYGYDVADHMISMTNALGEMRRWVYYSCLMVAEVDLLGFRTTYQYDRFAHSSFWVDGLRGLSDP